MAQPIVDGGTAGFCSKSGLVSHDEKASKLYPSMTSESALPFRFHPWCWNTCVYSCSNITQRVQCVFVSKYYMPSHGCTQCLCFFLFSWRVSPSLHGNAWFQPFSCVASWKCMRFLNLTNWVKFTFSVYLWDRMTFCRTIIHIPPRDSFKYFSNFSFNQCSSLNLNLYVNVCLYWISILHKLNIIFDFFLTLGMMHFTKRRLEWVLSTILILLYCIDSLKNALLLYGYKCINKFSVLF